MALKIAVWGSRGSGKTSLSVKLADSLSKKGSTILLFCDRDVPPMPVLFPMHRDEELRSLGSALSSVDITEDVIMSSATVSSSDNIIYLGYAVGENMFSYPTFGTARADFFLETLGRMADYVVMDCPSATGGDVLSASCLHTADTLIRVYNPELSSFMFFQSQLSLLPAGEYSPDKHINVLCRRENGVFLPETEAKANMKHCELLLPYSKKLKQHLANGTLPGGDCGRPYMQAVSKLVKLAELAARTE